MVEEVANSFSCACAREESMGGAVRAANLRRRLSFPTVCAPHALVSTPCAIHARARSDCHCPQTANSVKESEKIGAERVAWSLGNGPSRKGAKPQRRKGTEKSEGKGRHAPRGVDSAIISSSFLCGFAAWRLCVRVSRARCCQEACFLSPVLGHPPMGDAHPACQPPPWPALDPFPIPIILDRIRCLRRLCKQQVFPSRRPWMRGFRTSAMVVLAATLLLATSGIATAGWRCRCHRWSSTVGDCVGESGRISTPAVAGSVVVGVPTLAPPRPASSDVSEGPLAAQQRGTTVYVTIEAESATSGSAGR